MYMKLKMLILLVTISLLVMATSCIIVDGLPQDSSNLEPIQVAPAVVEVVPPAPAVEPIAIPEKTYQIGSKGPAGGFIVYDKGSITDGWRYLELAPVETEFDYIEWGGSGTVVGELQPDIGSGLENTKRIVSVFGSTEPKRGNNYPAKMCDTLVYNGYSDWFLPSIEELKLVYTNLIARGLGDFVDPNIPSFWSSNERVAAFAWYMHGANGSTSDGSRDFKNKTRAMRRF